MATAHDVSASLAGLHDWLRLVLTYRAPHPDSQRILELVEHLIDHPHKAHVTLYGEPGTGKEGLARALHQAMHPGGKAPFVKMPSGGRDPAVLALHLFGTRERRGAIARADGGTLFLDEIATLPREIQARLAPVLRGHFRRNDDEEPQSCEVTVMAATDHDLEALVAEGHFRHDLFYRLSRVELSIPPLRERTEDIPRAAIWAGNRLLAATGDDTRLVSEGEEPGEHDIVLEASAAEVLQAHGWPGNFRELDRLMERLLFLTKRRPRLGAREIPRRPGGVSMIPLARPWMGEAEEAAVLEVLRSGWLTGGPKVAELEARVAERAGRAHGVAVSSGTAALEIALLAVGVGPGDEVLCPALTWPSPAHTVVRLGARVVLVDADPDEWNGAPEAFAAARTDRTRAAIVIDQFGNPARGAAIAAALGELPIVEDAACALGSRFADGSPCGSLGAIGCFSFHPRKVVTSGEGGVCVTDDADLAEAMRTARNHGQRAPGVFDQPASNLRMPDITAAIGAAQVGRLETILAARRAHAEALRAALGGAYQLQVTPEGSTPNHQTLGALLPEGRDRDAFIAAAAERGVQVGRLSYAVDRLGQVGAQGPLPVSHALDERGVAFPLFPTMTDAERAIVIDVLEALA